MTNNFEFTNAVRIYGHDEAGRPRSRVAHNTLTFAAADTMIAAMLQSGPFQVTHLYAQHGGSATAGSHPNASPSPLPADLRTATRADFVATESTYNSGGLWVPLLTAPAVESTDVSAYGGNLATYFFRIPGSLASTQYTGAFIPGTSRIYSLALGVTVNPNDRSQDRIISVQSGGFTPFVIAPSGQESVDYPFLITIKAI